MQKKVVPLLGLTPFVSEDHLRQLRTKALPWCSIHLASPSSASTVQGLPALYTVGIVAIGVLAIHTCAVFVDAHGGLAFRTEGHHLLGGHASSQDPILSIQAK